MAQHLLIAKWMDANKQMFHGPLPVHASVRYNKIAQA